MNLQKRNIIIPTKTSDYFFSSIVPDQIALYMFNYFKNGAFDIYDVVEVLSLVRSWR